MEKVVEDVVVIPDRADVQLAADIPIEIGGPGKGVVDGQKFLKDIVVHKGVHVDLFLIVVPAGHHIRGVQPPLDPADVPLDIVDDLLGQILRMGITDIKGRGGHLIKFHLVGIPGITLHDRLGHAGGRRLRIRHAVHLQQVAVGSRPRLIVAQIYAVLVLLDGFHQHIDADVFPVQQHFTEAHLRSIPHDLGREVHPHIVAQQRLIQEGTVEGPVVVRIHAQKRELQVLGAGLVRHQLDPIVLFRKIAGAVPPDAEPCQAALVSLIRGMVPDTLGLHRLDGHQDLLRPGLRGGVPQHHILILRVPNDAAGDLLTSGLDADDRQMGAEVLTAAAALLPGDRSAQMLVVAVGA